jgi:3-phosphoshikimate 1-carboxyvinyltransferase
MQELEKSLKTLGAECKTNKGYLPIQVKGPIKGGEIELDGSLSSQFLSGLLFALPLAEKDSVIHVKNLKSRPYIDLTVDILQAHGIRIENQDYQTFRINGNQEYKPASHTLEGDWSNGAFLMTAAAINGNIELKGLNTSSLQGDKKVLEALESAGVSIILKDSGYRIEKTSSLKNFEFDATDTPDLFPPLACLAVYCQGRSYIKGVKRLLHKESNRAESLIHEFKNLGIDIKVSDDMMVITGGKPTGGTFDSHNDHRIAMAGAITALHTEKPVTITHYKAVRKSYPHFFDDLNQLHVKLKKEK